MTSSSGAGSVAGGPLPKWQLALAVGAPVAIGLGYMYYKNSIKPSPKSGNSKTKSSSKENGTAAGKQISIDGDCQKEVSSKALEAETPSERAQLYKIEGNDFFRIGKYDEAIAQYSNAIEACPEENTEDLATFYQNRAAAYEQLKNYNLVKADCTKALELRPKYAKAWVRRARAHEHCNELESALEDVTAACLFEGFTNQMTLMTADRVLKQLGRQHALEDLANKKLIMPSEHFIKTYISTFHKDPVFSLLQKENDSNMPVGFVKALTALREQRYDDIIELCTEEIDTYGLEARPYKMELMLLRATFYLLLGKHDAAIADFKTIINDDTAPKEVKVNALIKQATLFMQLEDPVNSFSHFEMATLLDPDCADIYHHRGQVNLLMESVDKAKADFKKAVDLNPKFGVAYVQKCYADYRFAIATNDLISLKNVLQDFEDAIQKFPDCPECYTLYAQILSETQEYERADTFFAKAIEKDPDNATIYVHRGLLQLQRNGDIDKAIEYIRKALTLDDKCEFGYETLGTIEVQRGNLTEAVKLFDKALVLGRTAMELTHIYGLRDAARTQLAVKDRLAVHMPRTMQNMS
ncbi:hypothetical protein KM043_013814 [Ampulex compressa]|nr:hypothetical protein KM043_013814 [Ampulex compressa]